jgi:methylmalonyl-CoA mutase cobalamin-binding domain/chain
LKSKEKVLDNISDLVASLGSSDDLNKLLKEALSAKIPVVEIVEKGLSKGLIEVGAKYEKLEYFLAELIYGGDLVAEAMKMLEPYLKNVKMKKKGIIAMGTVLGDVHDIGKNIVAMLMRFRGWEVHDLGVDTPPEKFVKVAQEINLDVIGMTSLLTTTTPMFKTTIDKLKEAKVRDRLKVIIGGNAATEEVLRESGADAFTTSAEDGIRKCEEWTRKK